MVDGKARLLRDDYCDGLGDCLPACPTGAISFEEREAAAYDEETVQRHKAAAAQPLPCGCPGSQSKRITHPRQEKAVPCRQNLAVRRKEPATVHHDAVHRVTEDIFNAAVSTHVIILFQEFVQQRSVPVGVLYLFLNFRQPPVGWT